MRARLERVFYGARGVACYSRCDVRHTLPVQGARGRSGRCNGSLGALVSRAGACVSGALPAFFRGTPRRAATLPRCSPGALLPCSVCVCMFPARSPTCCMSRACTSRRGVCLARARACTWCAPGVTRGTLRCAAITLPVQGARGAAVPRRSGVCACVSRERVRIRYAPGTPVALQRLPAQGARAWYNTPRCSPWLYVSHLSRRDVCHTLSMLWVTARCVRGGVYMFPARSPTCCMSRGRTPARALTPGAPWCGALALTHPRRLPRVPVLPGAPVVGRSPCGRLLPALTGA